MISDMHGVSIPSTPPCLEGRCRPFCSPWWDCEPFASITLPALLLFLDDCGPDDDNGLPPSHPCLKHNLVFFSAESQLNYQRYPQRTRSLPRAKRSSLPQATGNQAKRFRRLSRRLHIPQVQKTEREAQSGCAGSANTRVMRGLLTNSGMGWEPIRLRTRCSKCLGHAFLNHDYLR